MESRRIAILDRDQLFREGLRSLLSQSQFIVVFVSERLEMMSGPLDAGKKPDLIIYGLDKDDELPNEIARHHTNWSDDTKVVLLANAPTAELLRTAAEAGVHAVLSRNISGEVLQRALEYVLLGQRLFPAPQSASFAGGRIGIEPPASALRGAKAFERSHLNNQSVQLSEREAQILGCLVEGASNKQIARGLGITEATVKVHIKGLLRKLRVNNRTQAAVWGLHNPNVTEPAPDNHTMVDPLSSSVHGIGVCPVPLRIAS